MKRSLMSALCGLLFTACAEQEPTVRASELALRSLAAAFESADTALIVDLFAPDARYDDFANQATYEGIDEIVGYVTAAHSWGDDVYMNIGQVHSSDAGAVGEWVFSAIQSRPMADLFPEATGREVVMNGVTIVEMLGGRIVRAADYTDTAPLMLQLGGRIVLPSGEEVTLDDVGN